MTIPQMMSKPGYRRLSRLVRKICFVCVISAKPVSALSTQTPAAGDSVVEAKTKAIARQLRCPVCQGLSIQDSPSDLSVQMKSVVREMVVQGKSEEEIKSYFVSKYGEWILLAPKPAGMNMLVYLAPFILLIAGGGLIVFRVRKWTAAGKAQPG